MFHINFNLNNLICFFSSKKEDEWNANHLVEFCKKTIELNQGVVGFEILFSKILIFLSGEYGFINRAIINGKISFTPLIIYNLPVNGYFRMKKFYNIPLHYNDKYVGSIGLGGSNIKFKKIKMLNELFTLIAKELYKLNEKEKH